MKNNIKVAIFFSVLTFVFSLSCTSSFAGSTYITRNWKGESKAVFTQVQGPGLIGLAWQDPSGTIWSNYQGDYDNAPINPDSLDVNRGVLVSHSNATDACSKIGGRLPDWQQIQKLQSYFDFFNICPWSPSVNMGACNQFSVRPSQQAINDIDSLFPGANLGNRNLWTREVNRNMDTNGVFFTYALTVTFVYGPTMSSVSSGYRLGKTSVICVAP